MNRERWPTVNGLPVVPDPECYEVCPNRSPFHNQHHLAFPRREHHSSLERSYRNAASMVVKMCMCKHQDLHATYSPPIKPSPDVMRQVIQGQLQPPTEAEAGVVLQIRPRSAV